MSVTAAATDRSADPIYLVATAGHPNYGDEFITASWLKFLARTRPDAEVWLDCPRPGMASHLFGGLHPRLRTTDTLFRLVGETRDLPEEEAKPHLARVVRHLGTPLYDLGLLDLHRAGTVHFLGGGHITSLWPHHQRLFGVALALRELTGARLLATGLGLVPVALPETLREEVAAFDHFSVRDAESAEASGAALGPDDAYLGIEEIPGFRDQRRSRATDEVWVALQSDLVDPAHLDSAITAVRAALTSPELAGRPVRYLEAIPGVDRIAFDRLSDLIPEEGFVPFTRLWREPFPAVDKQVWLTTRFHFHLLAAACGASGTALVTRDDYYGVKHRSLIEAGTGWASSAPGSTELPAPTSNPGYRATVLKLIRQKRDEAESLYPVATEPESEAAPRPGPARPGAPRPGSSRGGLFSRR